MSFKILDPDKTIEIPVDVAVCPYCHTKITISPDGWLKEDDGSWTCDSFNSWCETEPDMEADSDVWEAYLQTHSDMPYVYQLPIDEKITEWLKLHYRFNLLHIQKEIIQ